MSSEATLVSFALQKTKREKESPKLSIPKDQMIKKGGQNTHVQLKREIHHTACRPQKPKRRGDPILATGVHDTHIAPIVADDAR
jgi:hypothetical protein